MRLCGSGGRPAAALVGFVGILALSGTLAGSSAESLTVDEAVREALATYPTVAVSAAAGDEAHAAVGEAQAAWYPSLRLSAAANRYEEPMAVYPIHGFKPGLIPPFDETIYQGGLNLSYTLFDGGSRGVRGSDRRRSAR